MENVTPSDTSRYEIRYIFTTPNKRQKGAKANLLQLRTPRSEIRSYPEVRVRFLNLGAGAGAVYECAVAGAGAGAV